MSDGTPPPCTRAVRIAAPAPTSVAVLYFDNLSRDTSDSYLAEGLTDELITRLGQLERLQVKSRGAVRRFRGTSDDPAAVGRALGVAHLVSGSVRRDGDRLRVTVELTRASTGAHVWGDVLERTDRDLMSVESQMASAIATAVGGRLAPAERQTISARPTTNPAAYDHLLRGDFLLAHRNSTDARRALAEYQAAVGLDSSFARAWARIGLTYYLFIDWDWPHPDWSRDTIITRGFAASDRALAADSANADAWSAHGLLLSLRNPITVEGVVPALERAVRLDPRNAEAWHQLGSIFMVLRRDAEAITGLQRSLALDPQRMVTLSNLSQVYIFAGRDPEALSIIDSAVTTNPDAYFPHAVRGFVRLRLHDLAGAQEDADAAQRLRPRDLHLRQRAPDHRGHGGEGRQRRSEGAGGGARQTGARRRPDGIRDGGRYRAGVCPGRRRRPRDGDPGARTHQRIQSLVDHAGSGVRATEGRPALSAVARRPAAPRNPMNLEAVMRRSRFLVIVLGSTSVLAACKDAVSSVDEAYYRQQMMRDLSNLVDAEDAYFGGNASYTTSLGTMHYGASYGVTMTVVTVSGTGWSATARHFSTTDGVRRVRRDGVVADCRSREAHAGMLTR